MTASRHTEALLVAAQGLHAAVIELEAAGPEVDSRDRARRAAFEAELEWVGVDIVRSVFGAREAEARTLLRETGAGPRHASPAEEIVPESVWAEPLARARAAWRRIAAALSDIGRLGEPYAAPLSAISDAAVAEHLDGAATRDEALARRLESRRSAATRLYRLAREEQERRTKEEEDCEGDHLGGTSHA